MIDNLFLAWSWFGHGQLTEAGLAFAISNFVALGKVYVLKRLHEFQAIKSGIETSALGSPGFPPTEKEVNRFLTELEKRSPTPTEESLVRLFDDLPTRVQEEDIHRGNIPVIGEYLEEDSQVRHYMRSYRSTTPLEAHRKSRLYIWNHLYWAWSGMRTGVFHQHKWYDFIYDSSSSDFDSGVEHLASALHTIEDSYAPGHTKRQPDVFTITDIYYWPDTKHGDPSKGIPSHSELDDPGNPYSIKYYAKAREVAGAFILCVLRNLDQDQSVYVADCGTLLNTFFAAQL
jgi:hypothetical protein